MTVAASTRRNSYLADGSLSAYDYTFQLKSSSQMLVKLQNTLGVELTDLVLGVDYSLDGVGDANGGTVQLIDAGQVWISGGNLAAGYRITLLGNSIATAEQDTRIRNQGSYQPAVIENQFDDEVQFVQEIKERLRRIPSLRISSILTDILIEAPVPNEALVWNSLGTGITSAPIGGGGSAPGTPADETPGGVVNGLNTAFTIANAPIAGSFQLFRDGLRLRGSGVDYTLTGTNITMTVAPAIGQVLDANYLY